VAEPVRLVFLGGLGEIGRNCACLEQAGRLLLIDCGLMFPHADMPGVDLVLPDFSYLRDNAGRIEACVLTHGHEDHVGALPFLLREASFPVYGSPLTLGLAAHRIEEAGLAGRTRLVEVADGERRRIGPFDVEFIPVTHSVPRGFALAFHTPQGVVLHSGDFKLDLCPVDGRLTDLARIGALACGPGVRLLLSDSTNAEEAGHTASETSVGAELLRIFESRPGQRVIVTCFASHLHRVQQVVDAAVATGRKVATLGRSMAKNVELGLRLGELRLPPGTLVDVEEVADLDPGRVCVVSTGSQGEPLSAMALMAAGDNKWMEVGEGDVVVLSAHPVPGNEWAVNKVVDGLHRRGAEVIHPGVAPVHQSGHAKAEELKTLLAVARPEYFIPVHGEFRHLVSHARLATRMGVPEPRVLLCDDGDVVELSDTGLAWVGEVPAGYLYVDGIVGDVGHGVLRDRRALAEEGVVMVVATVDDRSGDILSGPEIITRGWVYAPEAEELLDEARSVALQSLKEAIAEGAVDHEALGRRARSAVAALVQARTRRRPMIVPVIMGG
jgi:ribonuclease J